MIIDPLEQISHLAVLLILILLFLRFGVCLILYLSTVRGQ